MGGREVGGWRVVGGGGGGRVGRTISLAEQVSRVSPSLREAIREATSSVTEVGRRSRSIGQAGRITYFFSRRDR